MSKKVTVQKQKVFAPGCSYYFLNHIKVCSDDGFLDNSDTCYINKAEYEPCSYAEYERNRYKYCRPKYRMSDRAAKSPQDVPCPNGIDDIKSRYNVSAGADLTSLEKFSDAMALTSQSLADEDYECALDTLEKVFESNEALLANSFTLRNDLFHMVDTLERGFASKPESFAQRKRTTALRQKLLSMRLLDMNEAPFIRAKAADQCTETETVPALSKALKKDPSEEVRIEAALSLGWFEQGVPALSEALKEEGDEGVRRAVALAFSKRAFLESIPALIEALKEDPSESVRRTAAHVLGDVWLLTLAKTAELLGDSKPVSQGFVSLREKVMPALIEAALKDPSRDVRLEATGAASQSLLVYEAVSRFIAALNDNDAYVREAAARALGVIGRDAAKAVPKLREAQREGRISKQILDEILPKIQLP